MRIVVAPHNYTRRPERKTVFLAGGISNCPDWQSDAIAQLKDLPNVDVFNPRRPDFNIDDPAAAKAQINWEFRYLAKSDVILFWFPKETLCPIALYELGYWNARRSMRDGEHRVFIGTHPEYARRFDVVEQTRLALDYQVRIDSSLDELVGRVREYLGRVK